MVQNCSDKKGGTKKSVIQAGTRTKNDPNGTVYGTGRYTFAHTRDYYTENRKYSKTIITAPMFVSPFDLVLKI